MLEGASRGLVVAAGLLLAVSVGARTRVETLRAEAAEAAQKSREAGLAFSEQFEGALQDAELQLLDERRTLMTRAMRWHATGSISFAVALLSLLAAWVARQLARAGLDDLLEEPDPPAPPPSPAQR